MASLDDSAKTLEFTPTWVVAAICTVIVVISLSAGRLLHYLGKFLKHNRQDALFGALKKIKEELMLLGFISLLLTVFQHLLSEICITKSIKSRMLPCKKAGSHHAEAIHYGEGSFVLDTWNTQRLLSGSDGSHICSSQGKVQLLSLEALHQLHMFIFVLAVVHVVFCATTMVLGGVKISQWKHWEDALLRENTKKKNLLSIEHSHAYSHLQFITDRAMGYWRKSVVVSWMMSFFKQFHASVTESDYRALRAGFITMHCKTNPKFDFHKYMMRALEDDFKKVVGMSWYLWIFVIIFLLLNVHGWHTYFWLSFLPLILLLAVGTKLELIITRLAQDITETIPADGEKARVKPSDQHFWFHKPGIVLYLIHFILFQNSFEIAFFFAIWWTYGFYSCIMEGFGYVIPRLAIGIIIQVLCSYSTLPLYAIVTQMGDSYKQAIFADHVKETLQDWGEDIRRKRKRSGKVISVVFRIFRLRNKKKSHKVKIQRMATTSSSCLSSHVVQDMDDLEKLGVSVGEASQPDIV